MLYTYRSVEAWSAYSVVYTGPLLWANSIVTSATPKDLPPPLLRKQRQAALAKLPFSIYNLAGERN